MSSVVQDGVKVGIVIVPDLRDSAAGRSFHGFWVMESKVG